MKTLKEIVNTPAENPVRELRTELIQCGSDTRTYHRLFSKAISWLVRNHPHLNVGDLEDELANELEFSF